MAVLACVGAYVPPGYPRGYYRQRQMEMEDIAQQLQTEQIKEEQAKITAVANSKHEEEVDNLLEQIRTALAKEEQWEEEGMDEGEEPEMGGGRIGRAQGMDYEVQASWNRRQRFSCGHDILRTRIFSTLTTFRCCYDRVRRKFCLDHRVMSFTPPCPTMSTTDVCYKIHSPRPSFLQNLQICFPEEGDPCYVGVERVRPCNEEEMEGGAD